jgi:uncharacterized protein YcfJ
MKRLTATLLVAAGLAASTAAIAQSRYDPSGNAHVNGDQQGEAYYDYAQVVRVDPVLDGRYVRTGAYNGQRCYETTAAGGYEPGGYYRNDGYRHDGNYDPYGPPLGGSTAGRNLATVVGGIAGAVLGSKVGGGSGTYAATAIGSMVGGMAGRQIYEQTQRDRYVRPGVVRVCDPEPVRDGSYDGGDRYGGYSRTGNASGYDVTYEYAGRRYTRRMDYHPGDRVRVRVDVSPQ